MTLSTYLWGMTKSIIFAFYGRFRELVPIILGFRGDLQGIRQYVHFLEERKNSSFCVYGHFVSYCPQFWGVVVIYKIHDNQYMFERHDRKLVIFMAVFVSYCP
jgi:hypothetical protein